MECLTKEQIIAESEHYHFRRLVTAAVEAVNEARKDGKALVVLSEPNAPFFFVSYDITHIAKIAKALAIKMKVEDKRCPPPLEN